MRKAGSESGRRTLDLKAAMIKAVTSGTKLSDPSFTSERCTNVQFGTSLQLSRFDIRVTYCELQSSRCVNVPFYFQNAVSLLCAAVRRGAVSPTIFFCASTAPQICINARCGYNEEIVVPFSLVITRLSCTTKCSSLAP